MGYYICVYCEKDFKSKHSTALFCSRKCSGINSHKNRTIDKKYTDEELILKLIEKHKELKRTPSKREMKIPSSRTYSYRFGSWNNAVFLAGLEQNIQYPKSFYNNDREHIKLKLRFKILNRDNFSCRYCGGTPSKGYILHVDHVIPFSKGGKTEEDNLITSCVLCNLGKSNY